MAYTVFARKYRPQTFDDLVGQEHVTRTLMNAIRSERVAHAFLFTGVRGVGKTTTARILAKALNCESGPTPEPCGTCEICVSIADGRDTDVLEMDGASNNSVEDVRRLQESIPYRPSRDRFKVVIVDEVHMLSTGAFNAFLKTLEEPPEHVKFIFATTEAHKVPVTIRSRCQRYDFRLIPETVVTARVREILESESIEADDGAVAIVAREAAGSMRDALTLLDQIVAFGGEKLVGEEVARVLGIADRDAVHRVAAAVIGGDGAEVLRMVDALASRGLDMLHFARQLLGELRDLVVLQVAGAETDLVSMVDEERARALEIGGSVELAELQRAFSAMSRVVEDTAQSGTPRTALEMGLVRIATRPPLLPLAELVARMERLESRGRGSGGPRSRGGGSPSGGGGRAASASASAGGAASGHAPSSASAPAPAPARAPAPSSEAGDGKRGETRRPGGEESAPSARGDREGDGGARTEGGAQAGPGPGARSGPDTRPGPGPDTRPGPGARPGPGPRPGPERVPGDDAGLWERLVGHLMETKPALGAVLQHGAPERVEPEVLRIAFPPKSFFATQAEAGADAIAEAAAEVLGQRPAVEVTFADEGGGGVKTLAQVEQDRRDERIEQTRQRALNHPLVKDAASLFSISEDAMHVRVELE